jgi:multidrug efflux pump subunit AcrB
MPSSVFPQTDFPRVVIIVNNGIMPADEMMATVTRPIEEAMKDIPGAVTVRSATKRGSAQINVFFNWHVDMVAVGTVRAGPALANPQRPAGDGATEIERVTFSAFPIIGISLTSSNRDIMSLVGDGELRIEAALPPDSRRCARGNHRRPRAGISRHRGSAEIAGRRPRLADVSDALTKNNVFAPAGMMEENYHLYLTTVDGRVHSVADIEATW